MGRHGYCDDHENPLELGRWRGVIASATRGKRGQAFFRRLIAALDTLPEKKLVRGELEKEGAVCALGALGKAEGANIKALDTEDWDTLGETFNVAPQLTQEVMWENDDGGGYGDTDEQRWGRVRAWAQKQLTVPQLESK